MSYLGTKPSNQTPTYKQVYEYTATSGQTTFTASYTVGFVAVFRNGVQLHSADYIATNGTSVVLANACTSGDAIRIESAFTANVQGAIPNTAGAVVTSNIADANVTQAKLAANVAGNGPAFSAYQSSQQTITQNTYTKVQFQSEEFDTANAFDSTTNYRFQPSVAGYYQFNGAVNWTAGLNGAECFVVIYKNGSAYKFGTDSNATTTYSSIASGLIYLNGSTDYVEFYCYQATAGTKQLNANNYQTFFQGFMARAA